jgi:class 3 adenylate cyclase/tetratricopeptide (TPR) repeat protein
MRCPECQTDNPDDSRFCRECGISLEITCPKCSKANLPDSKFCTGCGHDLRTPPAAAPPKDLSFDEKLAKIQKYLPSGLSEKILAQRDKIEGERRQVTIMFVDMKGFTPLTEKLGPEETFGLMDQVYEIMIHKVHDYEGTVNELRGDGILALFGAPLALEDAPQRAIRSSLAMHRELVKFGEKVKAERGIPPILVRIGINTGPVVVGTLGNDLRVQFTAVGDTINMAARMEQIAEPGTTYVTEDTFKLTEGFFRFEALGEKQVKGKEEPLKVYRVIAPSTRRTRFDVSAERGLTPLVGRQRELELLLDGFERAKRGRGQAFSIVGEAGVGKSRLLYEFRKAVSNENVTLLEGKCLSYGRGVPYHPFIDILKANFDVQEGDGDSEIREKVKRGLEVLGADEASTAPYFLELLSVKDSGMDKIRMSPEGKKDKIIQAIKNISHKGSEIRPLIIAIEDLHWMDKDSDDVSRYLLESIPGAKILLLFTYRPEYVQNWGGKSYHSQVTVNRLSDNEGPVMASHVLGSRELDNDLKALIQDKTEGVPFFIEEFIRSLNDLKVIERKDDRCRLAREIQDVTIPSTIQDVIMARVDRLPEGPKEVLQVGSVVEREFSHNLLKEVTGLREQELLSCLSVLKDSELLYERGVYPESTCIFKHALTREVVYDSILPTRRKKLHVKIGNAIEKLFKANIDEHYGILAEHYIEAENWERAAEYSKLALKKAEKTVSLNDAIAYSRKRIACLEKLPVTEESAIRIIDARTSLGLYYLQLNDIVEATDAVASVVESAIQKGHNRRLSQIHTIMASRKLWVDEEIPEALDHLNEALNIASHLGDMASLFFVHLNLGNTLLFDCRFDNALLH